MSFKQYSSNIALTFVYLYHAVCACVCSCAAQCACVIGIVPSGCDLRRAVGVICVVLCVCVCVCVRHDHAQPRSPWFYQSFIVH